MSCFDGAITTPLAPIMVHVVVITILEVACTRLAAARSLHRAAISRELAVMPALEVEIP
ncbi:MAG TPA: hypothetical protein VGH98_03585 [Gemmatimonadaceae bacterium]